MHARGRIVITSVSAYNLRNVVIIEAGSKTLDAVKKMLAADMVGYLQLCIIYSPWLNSSYRFWRLNEIQFFRGWPRDAYCSIRSDSDWSLRWMHINKQLMMAENSSVLDLVIIIICCDTVISNSIESVRVSVTDQECEIYEKELRRQCA